MGSSSFVHPSSVIDEGAILGANTNIWHFCHIFSGAIIGENCVLGQGCSVAATVEIGNNVKIQNGVSLYDGVKIEDGVFCGPHMVFTNVINPRSFIERKDEYRKTLVRCGASIGAGAIVICGNTIGKYAFVGAGAVITKDVADYALVYGNPATQHGWVGQCGTKLNFDNEGYATGENGARYILKDDCVSKEEVE